MKTKTPKLIKLDNGDVDNAATGAAAKAYRISARIKAVELSKKLRFSSSSSITYAEKGRFNWNKEFLGLWIRAVNELTQGNTRPV